MPGVILFTWDPRKAESNAHKHGVDFDEASSVFLDDLALLLPDPSTPAQEQRFLLLGMSARLRVLVVCYGYQEEEHLVRLISARRASPGEAARYHRQR